MITPNTITAGEKATWLTAPYRYRNPGLSYRPVVRVLDVRKNTAVVLSQRQDGTIKRRFVKLANLLPGSRWG